MSLDSGQLTGGIEAVVDCVGLRRLASPRRLRITAPGGTIHAGRACRASRPSTSPACGSARSRSQGAYAYQRADFDTAVALVADLDLGRPRRAPPTPCSATRTPSTTPPRPVAAAP